MRNKSLVFFVLVLVLITSLLMVACQPSDQPSIDDPSIDGGKVDPPIDDPSDNPPPRMNHL